MNNYGILDGVVFPIKENGVVTMYITDAPQNIINLSFNSFSTLDTNGFLRKIEEYGYKANKYHSPIYIDFDSDK